MNDVDKANDGEDVDEDAFKDAPDALDARESPRIGFDVREKSVGDDPCEDN